MRCSVVVPQTPSLYYLNSSLSSPVAVEQWSTLPLYASALLYCGADASPAPNYTLTYSYGYKNKSNSSDTSWGYNPLFSTSNELVFTIDSTAMTSYTPSWMPTMPTWAALNATALGVNESIAANIACTAVNALGTSSAVFNVTLAAVVGMCKVY